MASEQILQKLEKVIEELRSIEEEKLLRTSLGEESLKEDLSPFLNELNDKIDFAKAYSHRVHDSYVNKLIDNINTIKDQLNAQAGRNNQEYIANKQGVLDTCKSQLEQMRLNWAHFVATAVEERGFLQDEGIKQAYENTVNNIKNEAEAVINNIKEESNTVINEAKKLAEEIETRARKTAAKISVAAAQEQFKNVMDNIIDGPHTHPKACESFFDTACYISLLLS